MLRCVERVGKQVVFVHAGCCNKIPQTGWLTNSKRLFLTVLESGRSGAVARQIQCLQGTRRFIEVPSHCVRPKAPPLNAITFGGSEDTSIHTRANSKHMVPARNEWSSFGAGEGGAAGKGRGPTWRHSKGAGRKGKNTHLVELNYGLDLLSQSQAGKVTLGEPQSAGCNWI